MALDLAGKVALLTERGSGLGLAAAERFAAEGACVLIAGQDREAGEALVRGILRQGGRGHFILQSACTSTDWCQIRDEVLVTWGKIDIFVNDVGHSAPRNIVDMSADEFHHALHQHLRAAFIGLRTCAEAMKGAGIEGSIILVTSAADRVEQPGYSTHGAVEGGVRIMTKSAALELGPHKIRVNCLHVTMKDLETGGSLGSDSLAPPLGGLVMAGDSGGAVLFLASERSNFMTGTTLFVNERGTVQ